MLPITPKELEPDEQCECAAQPLVCIAEDDRELRRLIEWVLLKAGYAVTAFSDGQQLADYVAASSSNPAHAPPPDLIIADVAMPRASGLEVLSNLRRTDWLTPVILISAFADARTRADAHRMGAMVLDKPFDLIDLRMRVDTLLPRDQH